MPTAANNVTKSFPGVKPVMPAPAPAAPAPAAPAAPAAPPMGAAPMMPGAVPPPIPGMVPGKGPVSQAVNSRIQQNAQAAIAPAPAPAAPAAPAALPQTIAKPTLPKPGGAGMAAPGAPAPAAPAPAPAAKTAAAKKEAAFRRAELLSVIYQHGGQTKAANYLAERALINLVPRLFSKGAMLNRIKQASDKKAAVQTLVKLYHAFTKAGIALDLDSEEQDVALGGGVGAGAGLLAGGVGGMRALSRKPVQDPLKVNMVKSRGTGIGLNVQQDLFGQTLKHSKRNDAMAKKLPVGSMARLKAVIDQKGAGNVLTFMGKYGLLGSAMGVAAGAGGVAAYKALKNRDNGRQR